ncbi:hypothetical protein [Streptomyces inhibens]|uniref:hypothetical protein n=1 Tax=Streptomyces inhibens TaxID=2293571 RepID=UPI001EE72E56|nr:hypothetical protein [Streptomyces inhibens]UKY47414.1 hypothetical protein KI385_00125 [Streptomyces inhibens]UKY54984.1 hypothetical protein KI385_43765 [Streptomyces inhibens]
MASRSEAVLAHRHRARPLKRGAHHSAGAIGVQVHVLGVDVDVDVGGEGGPLAPALAGRVWRAGVAGNPQWPSHATKTPCAAFGEAAGAVVFTAAVDLLGYQMAAGGEALLQLGLVVHLLPPVRLNRQLSAERQRAPQPPSATVQCGNDAVRQQCSAATMQCGAVWCGA